MYQTGPYRTIQSRLEAQYCAASGGIHSAICRLSIGESVHGLSDFVRQIVGGESRWSNAGDRRNVPHLAVEQGQFGDGSATLSSVPTLGARFAAAAGFLDAILRASGVSGLVAGRLKSYDFRFRVRLFSSFQLGLRHRLTNQAKITSAISASRLDHF